MEYRGLLDMLDGGGAGRAGEKFEGGPLSGLLNMLGIRPMGYRDRLQQQATMGTSSGGGYAPSPAPAPIPAPITTTPLIGSLTPQDILAAIERSQPPRISALPPQPPTQMPTLQEMLEMERMRRGGYASRVGEYLNPFKGM